LFTFVVAAVVFEAVRCSAACEEAGWLDVGVVRWWDGLADSVV